MIEEEDKMSITEIQKLVFKEYVRNGYSERWSKEYLIKHPEELDLVIDLAEVGLFVTEIAELMEDIRDANTVKYGEEGADIVIRVLNYFSRKGIDIEPYILAKHEKNLERGRLHGRRV